MQGIERIYKQSFLYCDGEIMTEISYEDLNSMSLMDLSNIYFRVRSVYNDRIKEWKKEQKRIEKEKLKNEVI